VTEPPLRDVDFVVSDHAHGARLDRALRDASPGSAWSRVRRAIETGKVRVDELPVTDPGAVVSAGQRVELRLAAPRTRATPRIGCEIVFADRDVVVVNKPPLLSTVPFEPSEQGTLVDLVRRELSRRDSRSQPPLGVVHRLDKETSGLVMFARSVPAKRHLKQQLRFHSVHRRYLSRLVEDRGDGLRGSTDNPKLGQPAVTHVSVLARGSGVTLVECRLETGRTHQIRIHLSEAGHPLVGERVYVRGWDGARVEAPRLMLHAKELGFVHPRTEEQVRFAADMPEDMAAVVARMT
jgi:23S rRNA pseudouridine1911/1915/1917 synthase